MTIKSALSAVGNGALNVASTIHNSTIQSQIDDIDKEIAELTERRAKLENQLIH